MEDGMTKGGGKAERLDTDEELAKLVRYCESFEDTLLSALDESKRDRRYYDGAQWTSDELAELRKRGQPDTAVNLIAKKLNYVLGAEIEERSDPVAYPRTPTHDDESTAISDGVRYVADAGRLERIRSKVAEDQMVPGFGAAVCEVERLRDEVKIVFRHVPWDRFWYDPHSRDELFEDAKFKGVVLWLDEEDARANPQYKGASAVIDAAMADAGSYNELHDDKPSHHWVDEKRNRIKICEIYYRRGGTWHVAHFTRAGFLVKPQPSPYVDEYGTPVCPLEAVSCYVRDSDGARYGLVRNMVSVQDEINKRRSKALHLLNVRQVIAEEGAVPDPDSAREELAKPDGWITVNPGYMQNGGFQIAPTADLAQGQAMLLQEAKTELMSVGVDAAAGDVGASSSGRARLAAQQIANREVKKPFDHLRAWTQKMHEHAWWRIRQFWTSEMWLRVRDNDDTKGYRFTGLNRKTTKAQRVVELLEKGVKLPEALKSVKVDAMAILGPIQAQVQQRVQMAAQAGQEVPPEIVDSVTASLALQSPELQQPFTAADVAHLDVDIVLESSPNTAVIEQEEFESLGSIGPTLVQAGFPAREFVRLLVKASQLRSKREILQSLEESGQGNPMAEEAQAKQVALALEQATADIHKTHAQAAQAEATAAKNMMEAQTAPAKAMGEQAYAMKTAAEAGRASVPQIPVASQRRPMA